MSLSTLISMDNPVFQGYVFYNSLLVVKMMGMSLLTGLRRKKYKAFVNPEDVAQSKVQLQTHESVERVRRAHLNDLENIPIYFAAGFGYLLTNPSVSTALWLFRAFTAARFVHSFVYAVVVIPQPARGLSWAIGYFITGYMAARTALTFCC